MQQATIVPNSVHQPAPDRQAAGERVAARLKGKVRGRIHTDPLMTYAWSGDRHGLSGSHFHVLLALPHEPTRGEQRRMGLAWKRFHGSSVTV